MAEPNQFDIARKRAQQQSKAQLQGQQEALKRRFASMGAVSSGAALKQEQLAQQQAQEQLRGTEEQIGAAEREDVARKAEVEKAREFAIQERKAGEAFQAQQAGLNRGFQERVQKFAETQAGKQLDMALKEFEENLKTSQLSRNIAIAQAGQEGISPEQLLANIGSINKQSPTAAPIKTTFDVFAQKRKEEQDQASRLRNKSLTRIRQEF